MNTKRMIWVLFLLSAPVLTKGQMIPEDQTKAETYAYQSKENPWYWKNRKPFDGYWQQDVDYTINARLDDQTDIVDGHLILTYTNNSPDELPFVYFHLYQEAFQPGSYLDQLNEANDNRPAYGQYEQQGLGTEIGGISIIAINGYKTKKEVSMQQENTILRVDLPEAIRPGGSMTFSIDFQTYFDKGGVRRRMKMFTDWGTKQYDGVHWYPRICVYDRKFGWTTDQHLGKEFYGDFGHFDVRLDMPDQYIVGATGTLINPEEAMPEGLRKKLDIKNFADKPWGSEPSIIIPVTGGRKVWHFEAVNVHDFAWTADPTYRIGEAVAIVDGRFVLCQALAQEQHASGWQNAADYTTQIIETFSRDFGSYIWPKIIVADARDGMEYPMLTLDGGFDPYYRDLLIHEVGHMWFFGMLGNNETYRAMMDEGFTQFITAWGYKAIDGNVKIGYPETKKWKAKFREAEDVMLTENYYGYLRDAVRQNDPPLNTHSDHFGSALGHGGGYGHVYYKTAVMLNNLQYVLGDELFLEAMQHYVQQWKTAHPYPEDFRNSIIQYTGADLNWFFDQWMETNKNIDYAITDVKPGKVSAAAMEEGITLRPYSVTFERKGSMQMPLDFIAISKTGDTMRYYIPNTWFEKKVNPDPPVNERLNRLALENVNVLPVWIGWDKLNPTYTADIMVNGDLDRIEIDPSRRMADIDMLNNSSKCPVDIGFDSRVWNWPDPYHYTMKWRPDLWWNEVDGFKAGVHLNGNYFNYKHIFSLTAWVNSGLGQGSPYYLGDDGTEGPSYEQDPFSINFSYKTATDKLVHASDLEMNFRYLEGILGGQAGFVHRLGDREQNDLRIYFKAFKETNSDYHADNFSGLWNNSMNIEYTHRYSYPKGNGTIVAGMRSTAWLSETDFNRVNLEAVNNNKLGKFDLRTRIFAQGATSTGGAPLESRLYLAGANPEEMLDNKYTRTFGWFDRDWMYPGIETSHFQYGGGLNLRGYAGYLGAQTGTDGNVYNIYNGLNGASVNAELAFNRLFGKKLIQAIDFVPYLFADAGTLSYQEEDGKQYFADLRADAGIGATVSWKYWGPLEQVKPLTIRIDLPLWLNRPPYAEEDYLKFRWVLGVERAF